MEAQPFESSIRFPLVVQGRRYECKDYLVVFLIVSGLIIFMKADAGREIPEASSSLLGVALISVAMFIDATLVNIQVIHPSLNVDTRLVETARRVSAYLLPDATYVSHYLGLCFQDVCLETAFLKGTSGGPSGLLTRSKYRACSWHHLPPLQK